MNESNEFLKKLYQREDARVSEDSEGVLLYRRYEKQLSVEQFLNQVFIKDRIEHYKSILPKSKDSKILDIGVGEGWFAAICSHLGYKHIELADYGCAGKFSDIQKELNEIQSIHDVKTDIHSLIAEDKFLNTYDFIHMSHVIEHIPKYDLIKTMDALNMALCNDGVLFIRCPNMLGPLPMNTLYCTLGHEYGFIQSNLTQLFRGTNFTNIEFHTFYNKPNNIKQLFGAILRKIYTLNAKLKYRAFEGFTPANLDQEIIASAARCKDKDRLILKD
jgi:2-polyprenyl-3-methyl-5-hydroxy-6-metoxy-1,4-benzoquinol methylase